MQSRSSHWGLVSVTPLVTLTAVHGLLGERVVILVTHLLYHCRQQLQGEGGGREEGGREGGKEGGREGGKELEYEVLCRVAHMQMGQHLT